ncbi:MAG: thiamine phosphate synthase, partial [Bacteroidales bacterium]|nr:thiamine phosphate synthase [Bacteroidales bacterium]
GNKITGGTANTFSDIEKHYADGANYVGVGPFRFTETKKNLSPVLGLQGYEDIVLQCNKAGIDIPIFAIGGIRIEDIPTLMRTGIYGIAISSLILDSNNPVETAKNLVNLVRL